jgi:hypothetical protein
VPACIERREEMFSIGYSSFNVKEGEIVLVVVLDSQKGCWQLVIITSLPRCPGTGTGGT